MFKSFRYSFPTMNQGSKFVFGYSVCPGATELTHTGKILLTATMKTIMQGVDILLWLNFSLL